LISTAKRSEFEETPEHRQSSTDQSPEKAGPITTNQFLKEYESVDTPFCLFLTSNEPHTPWDKGDASRCNAEEINLPYTFVDTPATSSCTANRGPFLQITIYAKT
jgi:hypothetical protein